jgi:glycosyltransferase involved in cell wall biosynthesis
VAVIPAYRAAATLGATIAELRPYVDRVCVVDDGSDDATAALAQRLGIWRLIRQRRLGPGAAVRAGLLSAAEAGYAFAVVVDADGQMDPGCIPALVAPLRAGVADLVRGSRLHPSSGGDAMPRLRLAAARALRAPASWCAGQPIEDPLSGFVALRLSSFHGRLWSGFGYPMHLAAVVAAGGGRIVHSPVPARYPKGGRSNHGLHRLPSVLAAFARAAQERLR